MKFLIINFLAGALTMFNLCHAQNADSIKKVIVPDGYIAQLDVVYSKVGNWDGRMDLYLPPVEQGNKNAILINIHGGGWNHGTKESQTGFASFFKNKMAVANVEYRLTPQATAPAAVVDVRCAYNYIVNHAAELNIDVHKIVIMGGSAGGHLALMAGMLTGNEGFDSSCPATMVQPACIIDKYGITDVWDWGYGKDITSSSATKWLGSKKADKNFAASVSPINYVTKNTPPIFIVHGDADPTVPIQQSIKLFEALKKANVETEMITVEGGLHGKFEKETNSEINKKIISFINKHLK